MQECKMLTLKMYTIQYMLKYKILLKFTPKLTQCRNHIKPVPPFGLTKMRTSNHLILSYIKITITRHNKQCHNTKKAKKKSFYILTCTPYFLKLNILYLSSGYWSFCDIAFVWHHPEAGHRVAETSTCRSFTMFII